MSRTAHRRPRRGRTRFRAAESNPIWARLTALDFIGNSFQLAALAVLCFFPFLIVVTTALGRDTATVVAGWLGLDKPAAEAVAGLFKTDSISGSLTVAGACLLIVGAVAVAGVLQGWYQRVFDVPSRGWRDSIDRFLWLVALFGYSTIQAVVGRFLGPIGGAVAQNLLGLVLATLFWWLSIEILLAGAVRWRTSFPAAVATGACCLGLGAFSARFFSEQIVVNNQSYGLIGVVMVILSWLVAVGVVVHLGSVLGGLYTEHRARSRSPR
ncbi:YhjD/YihY/BrkB family envelope integrity protein [Actinomadura chokoriensis]|uniref:YhjD/YihY/BrkB family envelope integrity protein n=1 Tax=Actinomadura chokoriensis TaxID=454156 RepID=A0ABV4QXC8_9ACTN